MHWKGKSVIFIYRTTTKTQLMKNIILAIVILATGLTTAQQVKESYVIVKGSDCISGKVLRDFDITITGTSLHFSKNSYKTFIDTASDDTILGTAYIIDGKRREGYIEDRRYNPLNIGIVLRKTDGIVLGAYYNSYYNPSFLIGYNKSITRGISIDVGAVTGYDYVGWEKGSPVIPMYAINLDLGNVVRATVNHEFAAIGVVIVRY